MFLPISVSASCLGSLWAVIPTFVKAGEGGFKLDFVMTLISNEKSVFRFLDTGFRRYDVCFLRDLL